MIEFLKKRWKVKSAFQVVIILVVFACTGFTVMYLKKAFVSMLFDNEADLPFWFDFAYYSLILPIYQVFLLLYGFLFGQFSFFWEFEKRFLRRVKSWLVPNKKKDDN